MYIEKMMEWEAQIKGEPDILRKLLKLNYKSETKIIRQDENYYLKSSKFKDAKNASEVRILAQELLNSFNGLVKLLLGGKEPLQIGDVARIQNDGSRKVFNLVGNTLTLKWRVKNKDKYISSADSLPGLLQIAMRDKNVETALRLFGKEKQGWVELYRVYEVIKDDMGGKEQIINKGWATKKSISKFKRTANSPGVTGDDARHGKQSYAPPKNPMLIKRASSLIYEMLLKWLISKENG